MIGRSGTGRPVLTATFGGSRGIIASEYPIASAAPKATDDATASAVTDIKEGLYRQLTERNAADSAELLEAFDGRLDSRLAEVETAMEQRATTVSQRVDNTLESVVQRAMPGPACSAPYGAKRRVEQQRRKRRILSSYGWGPEAACSGSVSNTAVLATHFTWTWSVAASLVQFETAIAHNDEDDITKARTLVTQLRGVAADFLERLSGKSRSLYELLIPALEPRFGDTHLQQYVNIYKNKKRQEQPHRRSLS